MNKEELRRLQKEEGLKRLILMRVDQSVIDAFKNDVVFYSERESKCFDGILFNANEKFGDVIKDFEEKTNSLVYHAQLTHLEFGDCLALLFVGDEEDIWEDDISDLKEGYPFSYVVNLSTPDFSEYGSIGIKPCNGGISRVM